MTQVNIPPYWKNRWTEFNPEVCYKAKCGLQQVRVTDTQNGQVLGEGFWFCPIHRLFHSCGWSPCVEGICSCLTWKTHAYNGARCPTYIDIEGYLCCEVTRLRLETYPSFPFEDDFFREKESKETVDLGQDFETAARNYFIQKEGAVTEGAYDDIVFLSDAQTYPLLIHQPNRANFERFIDPKLFADCCHFDSKDRYKVYKALCKVFQEKLEFTIFKRKKKHNIRRAFHIACTQVFHPDTYKMLLSKHSFWSKTKTYRKLCRLQQHLYFILKVIQPIKNIKEKNYPPDPYLERLCRSLEREEKRSTTTTPPPPSKKKKPKTPPMPPIKKTLPVT